MANAVTCIGCSDELPEERAALGYRYCTKDPCQALYHPGVAITAVGVNKSADSFIIADPDEIRRRGEAGEFAKKDTSLGLGYRQRFAAPAAPRPRTPLPQPRRAPAGRPWTAEQEKVVRLYHGMGLTPRQTVERARVNAPRLGITEALVVKIMSSHPAR